MFEKPFKPKVIANIKRKSRSILVESFRLNPKGKRMSMMLVDLKLPSIQNLLQNKNSKIGIGDWGIQPYRIYQINLFFIVFTFSLTLSFPTSTCYSSLISMAFEDALAGMPSLGQTKVRLPRQVPPGRAFVGSSILANQNASCIPSLILVLVPGQYFVQSVQQSICWHLFFLYHTLHPSQHNLWVFFYSFIS